MARGKKSLVFIDTHILIWLYTGLNHQISKSKDILLQQSQLVVSPISLLEVDYLNEIGRFSFTSNELFQVLQKEAGLTISEHNFIDIIEMAKKLTWTRDTFDRLLVADATVGNYTLMTGDQKILLNYTPAIAPK